jgi:hypothetical protein
LTGKFSVIAGQVALDIAEVLQAERFVPEARKAGEQAVQQFLSRVTVMVSTGLYGESIVKLCEVD